MMSRTLPKQLKPPSRKALPLLAVSVLVALSGALLCAQGKPGRTLPPDFGQVVAEPLGTVANGSWYTRVDGQTRGAFFILIQPDTWNGDLVVLFRGGVPSAEPVRPPEGLVPLAEGLAAQGYGVAMSSYRDNGFSVFDGIIDSHIAEVQFTAHFGRPHDRYLWAFSMGSHILQHSMEAPMFMGYAGALSVCGALGGPTIQWETFIHKRALFDYFYPGVLPGGALSTPPLTLAEAFDVHVPAIVGAIAAKPGPAIEMTGVEQFQYSFNGDFDQLIEAVVLAVGLATLNGADLVEKAHGIPVNTSDTVYTGSLDDEALNAGIERFHASRGAARYLGVTDPKGLLRAPILELHNSVDPVAPLSIHRDAYLGILNDTGKTDLVLFREVDRFGHCELTPDEMFAAFSDLVVWAETGVRPNR